MEIIVQFTFFIIRMAERVNLFKLPEKGQDTLIKQSDTLLMQLYCIL